jgi:hypothetical protein
MPYRVFWKLLCKVALEMYCAEDEYMLEVFIPLTARVLFMKVITKP